MISIRSLLISVVLLVTACGGEEHQANSKGTAAAKRESALVVASNYPLYFFASRIAEGVDAAPEIVFPDIEGDPAFWIPSA
jgi:ABC-type Zn uptake system ZnuABC Zn-binding protein ZnuA